MHSKDLKDEFVYLRRVEEGTSTGLRHASYAKTPVSQLKGSGKASNRFHATMQMTKVLYNVVRAGCFRHEDLKFMP